MPGLDIPWLVHQEQDAAHPHDIPLSTLPPESRETARDRYYSLSSDRKQRPWYDRKRYFYLALIIVVVLVACAIAFTNMLIRRRSVSAGPAVSEPFGISATQSVEITPSPTQSSSTSSQEASTTPSSWLDVPTGTLTSLLGTLQDGLPLTTTVVQTKVSVSTLTMSPPTPTASLSPLSPSSHLASVFVDKGSTKDSWRMLVWQDEAGDLIYVDWSTGSQAPSRIRDSLKGAAKPKQGAPLAAAADASGIIHLFYPSTSNTISHLFKERKRHWQLGYFRGDAEPVVAHKESMLSAVWHEGENGTKVIVLSYQTPRGDLKLAMSDTPEGDDMWHIVDFNSFAGRPAIGRWDSLGHALAGDWRNPRKDSDEAYRGLLMAVEGDKEITPWGCTVDFYSSSEKQVKCLWLNGTFLDTNGKGISPPSRTSQLAWIPTGHGKDKSPASILPYEFGVLYIDGGGNIVENRVGVGLPRVPGEGFATDTSFDTISTTSEGTLYGRSGKDLLVFKLDANGWQWEMEGVFNTSIL